MKRFIPTLLCFIFVPLILAYCVNTFLIYTYLRNTLKMEYAYYKNSVYYLVANNNDIGDSARGALNQFCIAGIFPYVQGFSQVDSEKEKNLSVLKDRIEGYVLDEGKEERIEDVKNEIENYITPVEKENPIQVIKDFSIYLLTVLIIAFYFLELCIYVIMHWKFSDKPTVTREMKGKEK